jgi:hypothetical protein
MPPKADPNSKYSKMKAKREAEEQAKREEYERLMAELEEKQAELKRKESEIEEKRVNLEAESEKIRRQQEENTVPETSETPNETPETPEETPDETPEETFDLPDDLLNQLNAVDSAEKNPTDQYIIEKASEKPYFFDTDGEEDEEPELEIPMSDGKKNPDNVDVGLPPDETADLIIDAIDSVQIFVLPALYEREFFTPEERAKMRLLFQKAGKNGTKEISLDDTERELMNRGNDYNEYRDKIQFTDKERKMMLKPLRKLCERKGVELSPTWAFVIALVVVSLPRWTPIAAKKFDNWKEKRQSNATAAN